MEDTAEMGIRHHSERPFPELVYPLLPLDGGRRMTPHGIDIQRVPEISYGLRLDPSWDEPNYKESSVSGVRNGHQSVRNDLTMIALEKIVDLPNGIHVQRFAGPRSNYLREGLAIAPSTRIVLSVGCNHI